MIVIPAGSQRSVCTSGSLRHVRSNRFAGSSSLWPCCCSSSLSLPQRMADPLAIAWQRSFVRRELASCARGTLSAGSGNSLRPTPIRALGVKHGFNAKPWLTQTAKTPKHLSRTCLGSVSRCGDGAFWSTAGVCSMVRHTSVFLI